MGTNDAQRERRRGSLAVAICMISALAGVVAIEGGRSRASPALAWVGIAWALAGHWLRRVPWLWRATPGQIFERARQSGLLGPPLAKAILMGSVALFGAAAVSLFAYGP